MFFSSSVSSSSLSINSCLAYSLLGISLGSASVLSAIVLVHTAVEHLERLGMGSEEIFRGDRLPILPFPDQT